MKNLVVGLVVAVLLVLVFGAEERGTAEAIEEIDEITILEQLQGELFEETWTDGFIPLDGHFGTDSPHRGRQWTRPSCIAVGPDPGTECIADSIGFGVSGNLDAATATNLTDTLFSGDLTGQIIEMTSGPAAGESRFVTAHVGSTITVSSFSAAPALGDSYNFPGGTMVLEDRTHLLPSLNLELNGLELSFTSPDLSVSNGDFDLGGAVLTLSGGSVTAQPVGEGGGGTASCIDGMDNDADGLIDGADPECPGGVPQAIDFAVTPLDFVIPPNTIGSVTTPVGGGPGLIEQLQLTFDVMEVLFDLGGGATVLLALSGTMDFGPLAVGGTVELLGESESPGDASESSALDYTAPIAAAIAAGAVVLAAAGWHAKRRWMR